MITTNDTECAELMDKLRNHGASISEEQRHHGPRPYILPGFNLLGFNYRMTDLQGAVGVVQLGKLSRFVEERAKWASFYREQLSDIDWLRTPGEPNDAGRHAWQAFVTYVNPHTAPAMRNEIMDSLQKKGIATRPGTHAVHMLGYYKERFGLRPDDLPVAKLCDEQSMAIPLHNRMDSEDYHYIVEQLRAIR